MTRNPPKSTLIPNPTLFRSINASAAPNTRWLKGRSRPTRADMLFGEISYWGRATIWASTMHVGQDVYMNLAQWQGSIIVDRKGQSLNSTYLLISYFILSL